MWLTWCRTLQTLSFPFALYFGKGRDHCGQGTLLTQLIVCIWALQVTYDPHFGCRARRLICARIPPFAYCLLLIFPGHHKVSRCSIAQLLLILPLTSSPNCLLHLQIYSPPHAPQTNCLERSFQGPTAEMNCCGELNMCTLSEEGLWGVWSRDCKCSVRSQVLI